MLKKLVTISRSGYIESEHFGCGAIVDSDGKILKEWGDSSQLIFPRSALKPIQSLNLYKDGYIDKVNLTEKQIAFSTSSHFAEDIHQELIKDWLKNLNLDESMLACGEDWPWQLHNKFKAYDKYKKRRKIFHNCSGKHCAHLAVSVERDLPINNYNSQLHPLQKELFDLIENLSEFKINQIGVDGCTLPNPMLPINKFGYLLAKFTDYKKIDNLGSVAKKIFEACVNEPDYAGGAESDNSLLTKLFNKRVFFKNGAEGVFLAIIPENKVSIVVKILDGSARAAATAIAGMISELDLMDKSKLETYLNRTISNSIDQTVGNITWVG
jgi:L-asparaginase II